MSQPQSVPEDYDGVGGLLDGLVASGILPGASVLILRNGREAYYHQAGAQDVAAQVPIGRDTLYRIYSMTKPVTAAAIMILVDDGTVRLDDPVSKYIPEFAKIGVYSGGKEGSAESVPARPMTIKNLLTHTAGFTYWFQENEPVAAFYDQALGAGRHELWRFVPAMGGLDGLASAMAKLPLVSEPGTRWHYSMSLEVAGIVVERASGQKLDAFMKARIFDPLKMHDTGFAVPPSDRERLASLYGPTASGGIELLESGRESPLLKPVPGFSGGGGLVSTIDDYARFAEMLLDGGVLDGIRVLSDDAVSAMMTNHLAAEQLAELPVLAAFGLGGSGDGLGFGLGGAVVVDPSQIATPAFRGEYSWGGAASTTFWVDPQNQLVVVFMTQLIPPSSEMLRDKLHTAVYRSFGNQAAGS